MTAQPDPQSFRPASRRDGWSRARKVRFLDVLAQNGNVREAAQMTRISAQAAYVERRRDPAFAAAWDGAMVLALGYAEQVLSRTALDGYEEEVWYHGEHVGMRRKFDPRLLLAHLARLDKHMANPRARHYAARFDELLAIVAGEEAPEALAPLPVEEHRPEPVLPASREQHAARVQRRVFYDLKAKAVSGEIELHDPETGKPHYVEDIEDVAMAWADAEAAKARDAAAAEWDRWQARAQASTDEALETAGREILREIEQARANAAAELNASLPGNIGFEREDAEGDGANTDSDDKSARTVSTVSTSTQLRGSDGTVPAWGLSLPEPARNLDQGQSPCGDSPGATPRSGTDRP